MGIDLKNSYRQITWDVGGKLLISSYFGKKDDSGRGIKVKLLQNSVVITPTTETLRIYIEKPDKTRVYLDALPKSDHFEIELTNEVYAVPGDAKAELQFNADGKWVSSDTFIIEVKDSLIDRSIESSNELRALTDALDKVDHLEQNYAPELNQVKTQLQQIDTHKAPYNYVDTKIQANNLTFKESYATLAALQSAHPTGDTYNHVVLADGMIYTWVDSTWTNTHVQANGTGIADNSVGRNKVVDEAIDFFKLSDGVRSKLFNYTSSALYNSASSTNGTGFKATTKRFFAGKSIPKGYCILGNKIDIQYRLEVGNTLNCELELWGLLEGTLTLIKTVPFTVTAVTYPNNGIHSIPIEYEAQNETYIGFKVVSEMASTWSGLRCDMNKSGARHNNDATSNTLEFSSLTVATTFDLAIDLSLYKIDANQQVPSIMRSQVIVDINGNGDYTSVVEAVANEPENTTIIIMPGIYEGTIQAFSKRIILKGVDKNQCIIKSKDGRYDYPAINGSCGLFENLAIVSEYVNGVSNEINADTVGAYAFHCEDEYGVGKVLEFNNCILRSDFFPALGMGLRKDFECIINNCMLINNQIAGRGGYSNVGSLGALYFHDSIGVKGSQKLTVLNSIFRSNLANALCVYDLKAAGNSVKCEFIGNTIYSKLNGFVNNIWFRNQANPFDGNFELEGVSHGNTNGILNTI